MKPGDMVRIVNPTSPYVGATGHVVGRSEQQAERWMIRLTTMGQTLILVPSDVQVIVTTARAARSQETAQDSDGGCCSR